jgi:hypothetical protein
MDIRGTLRPKNAFWISKKAVKLFGVHGAVLLSYLADTELESGSEGEWFCATIENVRRQTKISENLQNKYIKKFEELGILQKKLASIPAKRYFKFNTEKIKEILSEE